MSTKIYTACRFKQKYWIQFIDLIHDQMFQNAVENVKILMKNI